MGQVALLEKVNGNKPPVALGLAVRRFRQREFGDMPEWVRVGPGVFLSPGVARSLGLVVRVDGRLCRPGHVMVGRG